MEAGEWYLMEDSWGSSTLRTKMRMASRRRGAEALATAVKALLTTAGNPSELSGTRIPSPRAIAPDVAARGAIGSVDGRPPVGASGGGVREQRGRHAEEITGDHRRSREITGAHGSSRVVT